MPAAFIMSAAYSFSTPSAITIAPLIRAKVVVVSMTARELILAEVIVRLPETSHTSSIRVDATDLTGACCDVHEDAVSSMNAPRVAVGLV